ncbi:DUF4166 domain-containing protein [Variovorax sp. JS1663]|uniref:DUF4166 domain-containing protein n=1 Tax=Variovorax sp. JS1663 TaxID=1851577 RepID=UPI000B34456B|nr:DUF4166 domain-containing protein [Variovorax sp. JS1663]OUM03562.1 hypothetical protein A8M77_05775 [Variovorax sp. JS1663]
MNHLSDTFDAETRTQLDLQTLVGAEGWRRLPVAVQRRFAHAHRDVVYAGELTLHCSPIGRVFAWASALLGGPLTAARGDAPARVRVHGDGRGGVVWERHLALAGHDKVVRSTKLADARGRLVERTDGGLSMALDVFEDGGALVFESRCYFFALGGSRLPIPHLLTPGTCRVEHHDLGAGRFRFVLSMAHPWWGTTFRQSGVFHDPEEIRS